MKTEKAGRGGARNGSGPKIEVESVRRVSVTLDPASIELAEKLGDRNVSRGIRMALRLATEDRLAISDDLPAVVRPVK